MPDQPDNLISNNVPQAGATDDLGLVAFADCAFVGVNKTMMLVINRRNGKQQIVAPEVVEGLKTCTTFKTIAEHAAHLADTRPELRGNQAMAVTTLETLNAQGMLLRASDICARLAQAPTLRPLPPTRVFVITCDRPAAVDRLLDSLLRTSKLSQHNALFLIDDSRDPANREVNCEAVARFNLRSAKEMFYVGVDAQQTLMTSLTEQLPQHADGIRFLLDPELWQGKKTYGRSRTLCLLLSVGYRALVMDDDILCEAIEAPIAAAGIGLGGTRKVAFYSNEQEMINSARFAEFDPLSGHASLLGTTFGYAVQKLNNGPLQESQLRDCNAAMASLLTVDAPILVTQSGSMGDPGTGGEHGPLFQDEDSMERLVTAPHGVQAAIEKRLNWLGSDRPTFFKKHFMSQLIGLDNSQLLPPYFPAFRGEDAVFGAMLVALHSRSLVLEYPWCVPHLPLEARSNQPEKSFAVRGDMGLFANYLTENIDFNNSPVPEHNIKLLINDALRMAARSDADLVLDFRIALASCHASQLYLLQGQKARTEKFQSPELQEYFVRGIRELKKTIAEHQSPVINIGADYNLTEVELIAEFRNMLQGFAAALSGWVEIRRIASELTGELISSRKMLPS